MTDLTQRALAAGASVRPVGRTLRAVHRRDTSRRSHTRHRWGRGSCRARTAEPSARSNSAMAARQRARRESCGFNHMGPPPIVARFARGRRLRPPARGILHQRGLERDESCPRCRTRGGPQVGGSGPVGKCGPPHRGPLAQGSSRLQVPAVALHSQGAPPLPPIPLSPGGAAMAEPACPSKEEPALPANEPPPAPAIAPGERG